MPFRMYFDDHTILAYRGDTVASALLASGIHFVGRSFKYHRPRGILAHGSEEPNALVRVDRGPGRAEPNQRATVLEALPGLRVYSQNHWPSLEHDLGALHDLLSPLFVAGFYYKTFMWPRSFWARLYEPRIRAAAGLGIAPSEPDADRYLHRYAHCDVLVVGAGPAGLAAALAAARSGKRVIVADEQSEPGGTLLHDTRSIIDGKPGSEWLKTTGAALRSSSNVKFLARTTAFAYGNHNYIALLERVTDHLSAPPPDLPRERLWHVRAANVVLATGAHERPLVFPGNDRPGIMLAESVRAYVNRYAVLPGRRIVIITSGASAYAVAEDCKAAGAEVLLVDVREESACGPELHEVRSRGINALTGHTVLNTVGRKRVTGVTLAAVEESGRIGPRLSIDCDCIGVSGGWTPAVHLFSQARGRLMFDASLAAFIPGAASQPARSAGAANGTYELGACLEEGWRAGLAAAGLAGTCVFSIASSTRQGFRSVPVLPADVDLFRARAFVDFQNDVTVRDIRIAVQEGFESVEHVKRYTTTGMATDQGKTSNMNALGIVAEALSLPIPRVGTTTFRPPFTPVTFGAIAGSARGALFDPNRETPMHRWAVAHGARFEPVSLWQRARYFPVDAEDMHAAVIRECKAVRTSVGMVDASTLGKIEVVGPDAAEFLNRMYVNSWSNLAPGKCRYGLMLKEDGSVYDDGVVARLAQDRFHVTTTTSGAPRVFAHMEEYLQTEWPDLNVFLTSTTEQWAVIAVQGPRAREVIAPLTHIDLSAVAFPHMSMRTGHVCGVPTRLFRVSFTGELGYEINVPAGYGQMVWEAVHASGQKFGITPYGTEALHVLRAERGFIIVGQETDGTVTPHDLGLTRMIASAKPDFVGKRSLSRPDMMAPDRKQLVGLFTDSPDRVPAEGAQLVAQPNGRASGKSVGHVTSSYWSAACGRSIALALVAGGRALKGRRLYVTTTEGLAPVTVTDPVFVDPEGVRVHA